MTGQFAVGDRVIAAGSERPATVIGVWEETFPRGGKQQVVAVRWGDGTGTAMRAAHFTHQPTDPHTSHPNGGQ